MRRFEQSQRFLRRLFLACLLAASGYSVAMAADTPATHAIPRSPYAPGLTAPRLITPQWVGEEGVDAVVVLAIDDMRDAAHYERFLRPILLRLKAIDGRAPVSIMTCEVDPRSDQLGQWIAEGLTIDVHTVDHPCPLLHGGQFEQARSTYERCVDLMDSIPGNRAVAFRMPCCDSLNTVSPRFFSEIFHRVTSKGNFLHIDSSVFQIFTADDPDIPRELVHDEDGSHRFLKYIPRSAVRRDGSHTSFVNTIENYPYPYVIHETCWEFPCLAPSDWEAQNLHGPNQPKTLEDWKAALDITVLKKGVMNLVFHPHGWMRQDQLVELIDYADKKFGKRVKFLTFAEALDRLNTHALGGVPLRDEAGNWNGVRVVDLNGDGFLDVLSTAGDAPFTRTWDPRGRRWRQLSFPPAMVAGLREVSPLVAWSPRGRRSLALGLSGNDSIEFWAYNSEKWTADADLNRLFKNVEQPLLQCLAPDLDGDGISEFVLTSRRGGGTETTAWRWNGQDWQGIPWDARMPAGDRQFSPRLRWVDIDENGYADVVVSDSVGWDIRLWSSWNKGWPQSVVSGDRSEQPWSDPVPPFASDAGDLGSFVHGRSLWWQNETTSGLPDLVARRSFGGLLRDRPATPKSPTAALRSFELRPGFRIELVAAEPLVTDPVAFDFGPDGSLWVVEMGDYPLGTNGRSGGRVRRLHDRDGDGQFDESTVFLDGLPFPTGVQVWRDGVLISAAPEILFARDTDGDGRADERTTLYSGFVEGNQQHRVNGLRWGLDNWIYCANGDSGGTVRSVKTGTTVDIRGRDFRIEPTRGLIDMQSGQTQFGRNRDDWGNWFGCNNSHPVFHYVLADHYLRRNSHLAVGQARREVGVPPGPAPVFPVSWTMARFNDAAAANRFTSACSTVVYRDDLFGTHFQGNLFTSEPVHNLVSRQVVTPDGVSFTSRRHPSEQTQEFLASSDQWFRPTMLRTGPDGGLWIADMYRFVIEHPEWIPNDWEARLDLRSGHDRGRIYRVVPTSAHERRPSRLAGLPSAALVALLDSPNGWQRDTIQRLLVERGDLSVKADLADLVHEHPRALTRLHALCTLDGLGQTTPAVLTRALTDNHAGVRRHAVRISEAWLPRSDAVGMTVLERVDDPDPQVQLQLAYTLGEWPKSDAAAEALGVLLRRHAQDATMRTALLSSLKDDNLAAVWRSLQTDDSAANGTAVSTILSMIVAHEDDGLLSDIVVSLCVGGAEKPDAQARRWTRIARLGSALDRRPRVRQQLATHKESGAAIRRETDTIRIAVAQTELGDAPHRIAAIGAIGVLLPRKDDTALLTGLLEPQEAVAIQLAALTQLSRRDQVAVADEVLKRWTTLTPRIRQAALSVLLSRPVWTSRVLDQIDKSGAFMSELGPSERQRLLRHDDPEIRTRAESLLATTSSTDRATLVKSFADVLTLAGNAAKGQQVFHKRCATCHAKQPDRGPIGPDLQALTDKSPQSLLTAVLDPNRAVESKYLAYTVVTSEGQVWNGLLASESGNSLTLVTADGKTHSLIRGELESIRSTRLSFMPEGIEKDVSRQDLADIFAFVRSNLSRPKVFDGNQPRLVKESDNGSIVLEAASSEIRGPSLVFEGNYRNLGFWASAKDTATWTLEVNEPRTFELHLSYACANSTAGNTLRLECADQTVDFEVAGTGTWDDYRTVPIGQLRLSPGVYRLVARSSGPTRQFLMDLKQLTLRPQ